MVLLQKDSKGRFLMTVPKRLVEKMGWDTGDDIVYLVLKTDAELRDGDIVVRNSGV